MAKQGLVKKIVHKIAVCDHLNCCISILIIIKRVKYFHKHFGLEIYYCRYKPFVTSAECMLQLPLSPSELNPRVPAIYFDACESRIDQENLLVRCNCHLVATPTFLKTFVNGCGRITLNRSPYADLLPPMSVNCTKGSCFISDSRKTTFISSLS